MTSNKELSAENAKDLKNKTDTFTQQDKISLDFLYQRIRAAASHGEAVISINSENKTDDNQSHRNTTDKILGSGNRLDRDVFEKLEDLDFRVKEYKQPLSKNQWKTQISWRDSDMAKFSSFAFGLRHGGGFPIV